MPNTNASFAPIGRTNRLEKQLETLDKLMQSDVGSAELRLFDDETEKLLLNLNCQKGTWLETYKYATIGEAEAMVNMPESAQQVTTRDRQKKALQQRRQVLQACLGYLVEVDALEAKVLRGEDHEDPPK